MLFNLTYTLHYNIVRLGNTSDTVEMTYAAQGKCRDQIV